MLLSHRGYSLDQIADILGAQYQTVSNWIDQWEDYGITGLYKHHGGGATAIFSTEEVERFKELVKDEPRRIRHAKAVLEEETEKKNFSDHVEEDGQKPWHGLQASQAFLQP